MKWIYVVIMTLALFACDSNEQAETKDTTGYDSTVNNSINNTVNPENRDTSMNSKDTITNSRDDRGKGRDSSSR